MKLWKLCHNSPSASLLGKGIYDAFLIAEYASSFGKRIMCLDASFDEEVILGSLKFLIKILKLQLVVVVLFLAVYLLYS